MSKNDRYLPPMRPLAKRPADNYLPAPSSTPLPTPPALSRGPFNVDAFIQDLIDVTPRERLSIIGAWRERLRLERNRKRAEVVTGLLNQASTLLSAAGNLGVARERFRAELRHAAKRAGLEQDIHIAELEAQLAHLRKIKWQADRDPGPDED